MEIADEWTEGATIREISTENFSRRTSNHILFENLDSGASLRLAANR